MDVFLLVTFGFVDWYSSRPYYQFVMLPTFVMLPPFATLQPSGTIVYVKSHHITNL